MSNYKVPNVQLREAYNRTLKEANFRGSAPFCCGPGYNDASYVLCQECPLNKTDCEERHDVKYWRQWWKELTGEGDEGDNDLDLLKKAYVDNAVKVASKEEAREIFDSHLQQIDDVVNPNVQEVIRCKDCKYFYQDSNIKVCKYWNCHSTTDDAYCSCAKMKGGK